VIKSKKLLIGVGIAFVLIAFTAVFYQSPQTNLPPPPTNVHHYQVQVNDTFAIGERHS